MFAIMHHNPPAIVNYQQQNTSQVSLKGNFALLKTNEILLNFEEISKIDRESGNCQEISEYLKVRFQKAGFTVKQNPDGTICAYRGLNKARNNAIILQSHMDMVAESADGNPKKPIKMHLKDGWLYANDRTLGADDGIGVSAMLAVAEDARFKNYPLEMIVTTDEETTMKGANALSKKDFYGKYLINIDSESLGVITKGCAGILEFEVNEKIKMLPLKSDDFAKITVNITGGKGGHSASVSESYFNPLKVLIVLTKDKDFKLISITGGEKFNIVPMQAKCEILVPKPKSQEIKISLEKYLKGIRGKNLIENPNLNYSILLENTPTGIEYVEPGIKNKLLASLDEIPIGLLSKFEDNVSIKTSQNLGALRIANGEVHAKIMGRSLDSKEGDELRNKTAKLLSEAFDKQISTSCTIPIWEAKEGSLLEDTATKAYPKVSNGQKTSTIIETGGLETAIFTQKKPNLQQISIGPTIEDPHSVQERVKVDTIGPFYNWLSKILEMLPKD